MLAVLGYLDWGWAELQVLTRTLDIGTFMSWKMGASCEKKGQPCMGGMTGMAWVGNLDRC